MSARAPVTAADVICSGTRRRAPDPSQALAGDADASRAHARTAPAAVESRIPGPTETRGRPSRSLSGSRVRMHANGRGAGRWAVAGRGLAPRFAGSGGGKRRKIRRPRARPTRRRRAAPPLGWWPRSGGARVRCRGGKRVRVVPSRSGDEPRRSASSAKERGRFRGNIITRGCIY